MSDKNFHPTKPQHEALYQDLCKLVDKHSQGMTPLEMLAVSANVVGKLLAMQDQTKVTVPAAMELIAKNIEHGNRTVVEKLRNAAAAGQA